jgi:predicted signal transduction protein with EAL and GGDEF domain
VLFVDLDRFKAVNDTYGHERGDRVLKEAARRLERCVRTTDTVARFSSDEFVIVLTGLARADDAGIFARKVLDELPSRLRPGRPRRLLHREHRHRRPPGRRQHAGHPHPQLRHRDVSRQGGGRNNFQYFLPEMHQKAVRRLQLETALRGALQRGEFQVRYQPRVNVASGEVTGFEALLRWQHPEFGLLSPSEFIPVLEDTGIIVEVGEWVLETVCHQLAAWRDRGMDRVPSR